jgi:Zn-dependent peptidase ImmA (M78 family)/DNA-binding XRE family transcriptional regulator
MAIYLPVKIYNFSTRLRDFAEEMADRAYITPKVLKWARDSARMSVETAARKVSVDAEKLISWEEGKTQPTIKQAETLAKAYKRPFALFFLPEVPRDFKPLQDFRRAVAKPLSTASVFIIREIQQKQAWISDVYQENGEDTSFFVGRFSLNDDPKLVSQHILNTLNINPSHYSTDNPIKEWIQKAESNGIFISRTSFINSTLTLDSEEMQGFTIADKYAPFIFINSDDWNAPQLFTLVHELAHIWIAATGISNEIIPDSAQSNHLHPVELFCNEVAANALMPSQMMGELSISIFDSGSSVFRAAKEMGVSSNALLVRALNLKLISIDTYQKRKREADVEFQVFLKKEAERRAKQKKEKKGGPNYYLLQLNKNSRLFTQIVLDAFKGGAIEPTQASNLLNIKVNNFSKLEAILYK